MKKFMVLYFATVEAQQKMKDASTEEAMKGMKPWMDWQEKIGDALVEMGSPISNAREVTKDGVKKSNSEVAGYSVLQADSIDGASEMLKDHPHLSWMEGAKIEVYEYFPLPGME